MVVGGDCSVSLQTPPRVLLNGGGSKGGRGVGGCGGGTAPQGDSELFEAPKNFLA